MTIRTERAGSRRATKAMARPRRSATSGVIGGSLATPRMPSVPKSFRCWGPAGAKDFRLVTEVHELQLDTKIGRTNRLDARLQIVPVFAGNADLGFMDRALNLDLLVLDELDDLARRLDGNPFF